ncbi:MAG: TIGR00730 family Rossman fold protein [Fermentimonas sp.]|jgi:uncharacterized protein (TIGR00730 family)
MTEIRNKSVVIYCASSDNIDKSYIDMAYELGALLAKEGIATITGAGKQGLMGAINNSVLENGGKAIGIIPEFMKEAGWCHESLSETIVTKTMHERKEKMAQLASAAIALPGGFGTLEELAEITTWKQLGLYRKPVILFNMNNYYNHLISFIDNMIKDGFLKKEYKRLLQISSTAEGVIDVLRSGEDWNPDFLKY